MLLAVVALYLEAGTFSIPKMMAMGNAGDGVLVQQGTQNRIGTNGDGMLDSVERNIIAASGRTGVVIGKTGFVTTDNVLAGNYIGTDVTGTVAMGNILGVAVVGNQNRIGTNGDGLADDAERNVIANSMAGPGGLLGEQVAVDPGNRHQV